MNKKLNLSFGEVKYKPFDLKTYMNYLIYRTGDDSEALKAWVYDTIEKNTNVSPFDLKRHDAELLIVHLIATSLYQDEIILKYIHEDDTKHDVKINIDNAQTVDLQDESKLIYSFKNFNIKFKYPKLFEDDDIIKMILSSIEFLSVGDEIIQIDDLSDDELNDLYSAISFEDIQNIKDMLLKPTCVLGTPITIDEKTHIHKIIGLAEFMRIL